MQKSTKGTLAAAAAAALLIGGVGTNAAWNESKTVKGSDFKSGHLKLVNVDCGAGTGWLLSGTALQLSDILSPGDVLTKVCTFEVDAAGTNLKANLNVTGGGFTGATDLVSQMNATAVFKRGSDTLTGTAAVADGDKITATITVSFPKTAATNLSQDLSGVLEDITVTATQQ